VIVLEVVLCVVVGVVRDAVGVVVVPAVVVEGDE
jgi:hypothetical protein